MPNKMTIWLAIWTKITAANTIAIYRHVNPDPDAYGSQFALASYILSIFPEKKVCCRGEYVSRLSYFYEDITPELTADLDADLHIVVDTANTERIDGYPFLETATNIIKIDHHPNNDPYGAIEYVLSNTPATSAMLLDCFLFMEQTKGYTIPNTILGKLYLGIVGDTGNFSYGTGLDHTFFKNIAVIFERINTKDYLGKFYAKSLPEVNFKGFLSERIILETPVFATVNFSSDDVDTYGVSIDFATGLVNILSEIRNVQIWASFCEDKKNNIIRCSLRSRNITISGIAADFGGGGHPFASGIRVDSWDRVSAIKSAIKELLANDISL
ncbi:oligoribonuclease [Erysipelotrichaceae bacterium]|nr:oligoribonuclease [Erysipelotrichaceae bacterium]